jgi:hypothetical protein
MLQFHGKPAPIKQRTTLWNISIGLTQLRFLFHFLPMSYAGIDAKICPAYNKIEGMAIEWLTPIVEDCQSGNLEQWMETSGIFECREDALAASSISLKEKSCPRFGNRS